LHHLADAEAGFAGLSNAYALDEGDDRTGSRRRTPLDQLSSAKKCVPSGGGKVGCSIREFMRNDGARLAADSAACPDSDCAYECESAGLLLSDADPRVPVVHHVVRTAEGFSNSGAGWTLRSLALAYAPYGTCFGAKPRRRTWLRHESPAPSPKFPGKLDRYNAAVV